MAALPPRWVSGPLPGGAYGVPPRLAGCAQAAWFDPARADAAPVAEGGRQAAWYVSGAHGPAVLRHYRRGGLRARLGPDTYLWLGPARVRAYAEARVLVHLQAAGVRVPEALGAAYWRAGPSYRAAILVARIAGAQALASRLDRADPAAVAAAIRAMHRAGVWHADLNAYNILFDAQDRVWLIDFDRARLGVVSPAQQHKNLLRLRRSLVKVAGAHGAQWWNALDTVWRTLPA
ncbi:3-deoxy-D-manno-octulosonic acid kinase [Castellaniella hirudinis]|uniref:3-deoxy-D-manno-octulosonic acid kinase n=1 Tax=Castellaniella hirudinis TaxID=1144617 RepID=UPI0039C3989A